MKLTLFMAIALGLPVPKMAWAQSESGWHALSRAVAAARASGDTTAYRMRVGALVKEVGATPRLATSLARLEFFMRETV